MIRKRRRVTRFRLASGRAVAAVPGPAAEPGCAVELTEIRAGGQAWWSLGFEATGSLANPELLEVMAMASGHKPADAPDAPSAPPAPPASGEHWWPVAQAIVVAAFLHVALPAKYRVNPPWLAPAVLLGLLAALIIGDPGRTGRQKTWLRILTGAVIASLPVANLLAAARLVHDIITSNKLYANNATGLLAAGGVIWATNVIASGLW